MGARGSLSKTRDSLKDYNKARGVFTINNDKGLHTRPSTELVKRASNFKSNIELKYHGTHVNAKSLLGILMLAASRGSKIRIEANGPDAQDAIDSIKELAASNFNIQY